MLKIKEIFVPGYKKVIEATNPSAKLHCFVAIHNTSLGPALGGTRIYPYAKPEDALEDVLRLAKSMTLKSAVAEDGLGGGKSVIIADAYTEKTEALLLAFAEVLNTLQGEYIAAEDVGSSVEDMLVLRKKTPYVVALPIEKSSGDPSRFTAWGVFKGIQAVAYTLWGTTSLKKKRITIQGLGHVGSKLADILFWEGAELILNDLNRTRMHDMALLYGAETTEDIYTYPSDIFSPCAMGEVINDDTVMKLRCQAVAGSANNQLARSEHGIRLMERGILYAPDYIINSGGIINASTEFEPTGYDPRIAREKINHLYERLVALFQKAKQEGKAPSQVADEIAEYNLKNKIGIRRTPILFRR